MRTGKCSASVATVVVAALLLASCAGGSDDGDATADASETVDASGGATDRIETWSGDDLLPAAGGMHRAGDIGVYFAVDGTNYMLAAIDVTTGDGLWRNQVHQHRRTQGVVQTPTVSADDRSVYVTTIDAGWRPMLTAFDLETGDLEWSAPSGEATNQPTLCGESSVCLGSGSDGHQVYDRADGSLRQVPQGGLSRGIGAGGDFVLTESSEERLLELGRLGDDGYHQVWQRSLNELLGAEHGPHYEPSGGWYVHIDNETGALVVALGANPLDDGENATDDEILERGDRGMAVAFVQPDGTTTRVLAPTALCMSEIGQDGVETCDGLESRMEPDGDDARFSAWFGELRRHSFAGDEEWVVELPQAAEWPAVIATSDPDLLVVEWDDHDSLVVDRREGDEVSAPDVDGIYIQCQEQDFDDGDDRMIELTALGGRTQEYLRAYPDWMTGVCDVDGAPADIVDVLADAGEMPAWFGPSRFDDDTSEPGEREGADRWAVWYDRDGVLYGAGPVD
jgi:hypothetical protein